MMDFGDRGYYFSTDEAVASSASTPLTEENYRLDDLVLLNRSVGYIRSNYVDPDRIEPRKMLVGALDAVQNTVAEMLIKTEGGNKDHPDSIQISILSKSKSFDLSRVDDLYEMTWKLKDCIHFIDENLGEDVNRSDVEYAVVNGLLRTLDPHSVLLTPKTYTQMQVGTSGKFGGLGIVISTRKGELTVMTVLPDTPAQGAGMKNGDRITQIGDESTVNMTLDEAVNRLRGEVGTEVTIWVMRDVWTEPRPIHIVRREIRIQSIQSRDLGDGIGYIKIKNFQQNTYSDLKRAMGELTAEGSLKNGLVLDLRNDPGGLLDQAVDVSDLFLADGTIVTTVGGGARIREEKKATRSGTEQNLPLVVLVNSGSASASEIVAGALKNNDRALIVGEQTFGKGSVQVLYEIRDQLERTAALKLTVAQYLTPGDQSIQSVGVVPDIVLYPVSIGPKVVDLYVSDEDLAGERALDNHLNNARATQDSSEQIVRYYEPEEEEEEEEEEEDRAIREYGMIEVDYPMSFAKNLLSTSGTQAGSSTLKKAGSFLQNVADDEDKKIRKRLKELGVDWLSGPESKSKSKLGVSMTLDPADGVVKAGDTLTVNVKVTNQSKGTLHQVRAVSESENPRLKNREWVFGKLAPGGSASWSVPLKIPQNAYSRQDPFRLSFFSDEKSLKSDVEDVSVAIHAQAKPLFAYSFRVDDVRGNRDGLLQKGEDVDLVVSLGNLGEGEANKTRAYVKNMSGEAVFLSKGKGNIEALPVGEIDQLSYTFKVQGEVPEGEVSLQVDVIDTILGAQTSNQIKIPIQSSAAGSFVEATGSYFVKEKVFLKSGATKESPSTAQLLSGLKVELQGRRGPWSLVTLSGGHAGWLLSSALVENEPTEKAQEGEALYQPIWMEVPPIIEVDASSLETLETDKKTYRASGNVLFSEMGERRRDVYIYRNEDKVYYTNDIVESERKGTLIPFSTEIPLEPGVNTISIFARRGTDTFSQRRILVHKR